MRILTELTVTALLFLMVMGAATLLEMEPAHVAAWAAFGIVASILAAKK